MANFIGALESFNPYIQQIPTDAYVKVGMFKEQQYAAGVAKVQETIDHIAGLDIANESGRQYLRARVDELTKSLNKHNQIDFANPNNITQLVGLAKPLYQDENIVNDVINTTIYRKWAKDADASYKAGKMELGQYMRETSDAGSWLHAGAAGSQYTGRSTPNTSTRKELTDRIIKAKKDGLEKNEYVYDINYSKDTPYYIKNTNKYYSEADFNNFITNSIMTERDREMLMNGHWYENMGVSNEELQRQDLQLYQDKIDQNNKEIERIKNNPTIYAGDKKTEDQQIIDDLSDYNTLLRDGKMKFLQDLNLNDPTSRDVFHRDLAESRFVSSLDILRDEVKKEEFQKNEQWFKDKEIEIELAKEALKATTPKTTATGKKKGIDDVAIDEVALFTPVDPSAPKTEVSLGVLTGAWKTANENINTNMNNLIGKLQENGVDMSQYIAGWDQVQSGTKAGAAVNVPRFRSQEQKDNFYNMVAGLNFAYSKEAEDGHLDNKSFRTWLKDNFSGYKDDDPNSKFTFADKMVSNALNQMKGTNALLPRLESLFADKGVARNLAQIDEALKDKKDVANVYREALLKSGALTAEEARKVRTSTDDDLLQEQDLMRFPANYDYNNYPQYQKDLAAKEAKRILSKDSREKANDFVKKTYSYIQEDVNSTVVNLKKDEDSYNAIKDGLGIFLTRGKKVATPNDLIIDGVEDPNALSGFSDIEIKGAVVSNTTDIFNPNPMYEVRFKAWQGEGKDRKQAEYDAKVSIKSFLATNPNYRSSKYAEYFAPVLYANKDAHARIKATINPLEGAEASYSTRDDVRPVFNRVNQQGQSEFAYDDSSVDTKTGNLTHGSQGRDIQWETIPIEKDGKQTMVSYQVVSFGQNTTLGNIKNKDGNTYAPGAFYVKLKIPTSTGKPKVIFLKKPNGDSYAFSNASNAHYTVRDLIFNNPDIRLDDVNANTGEIDYFTTNAGTIRGIFNSQLAYNGFSKLEMTKIKDALGKEIQIQQAKELQYGR